MLKASDIAPLLGLTTGRIYQLIKAGVLPATRVGHSIRIPRSAWDSWLKEQSRKATTQAQALREKSARTPVATAGTGSVESGA
jgi:excisionase family DNA binding protein